MDEVIEPVSDHASGFPDSGFPDPLGFGGSVADGRPWLFHTARCEWYVEYRNLDARQFRKAEVERHTPDDPNIVSVQMPRMREPDDGTIDHCSCGFVASMRCGQPHVACNTSTRKPLRGHVRWEGRNCSRHDISRK